MPRVSVVIPTFNHAQGVPDTVASVLQQSERDLEVLVVDDGSTDHTAEVIRRLPDPRIRYLHKSNGGPASARNFGLARAGGRYVAFLDHDDLWPPDFLKVMVGALEARPEFGLAYAPITVRFDDGSEVTSYKRPEGKSGRLAVDLFQHSFVWTSSAVMRKDALARCHYDESLRQSYEDGDFFLRLSARTPYLFVPEVQAIKREHARNLSREVGIQPTRILVLERFYFWLGGDEMIPASLAKRRLSHACRTVAEEKRKQNARAAALCLYKRAISYRPYDWRSYVGWMKAWRLSAASDPEPNWRMPEPLPGI